MDMSKLIAEREKAQHWVRVGAADELVNLLVLVREKRNAHPAGSDSWKAVDQVVLMMSDRLTGTGAQVHVCGNAATGEPQADDVEWGTEETAPGIPLPIAHQETT